MEDRDLSWRKSSYSGNGGATCVEVGQSRDGMIAIRDTTDRTGPMLAVSSAAWRRLAAQVKRSLASDLKPGSAGICRGTLAPEGAPSARVSPGMHEFTPRRIRLTAPPSERAGQCQPTYIPPPS